MSGTFVALYEPDLTSKVKEKTSVDTLANTSGYISINEMMNYFPSLKKKYIDSYEYFATKNGFEESVEYAEQLV